MQDVTTATPPRRVSPWLWTGALAGAALIAGQGLTSPVCYGWEVALHPNVRALAAYSPSMGMTLAALIALLIGWLAVLRQHFQRIRELPLAIVHIGLPLLALAWAAFHAALGSWTCTGF